MAESKIQQVLIAIAEIKKDTAEIFRRLDKINGSIADYPVSKKRVEDLEEDSKEIHKSLKETSDLVTNIKIKVWVTAGIIGGLSGFIGMIIGKFI